MIFICLFKNKTKQQILIQTDIQEDKFDQLNTTVSTARVVGCLQANVTIAPYSIVHLRWPSMQAVERETSADLVMVNCVYQCSGKSCYTKTSAHFSWRYCFVTWHLLYIVV